MGLTVGDLWSWLTDDDVSDDLLAWPPDVAALTGVLLERSHAFRFVVSPPAGATWPPEGEEPFGTRVRDLATAWCAEPPDVVQHYWSILMRNLHVPVQDLRQGRPWEVCEAALALHAVADEVYGSGTAQFTAQAREMLARTGSMSRLPADRVAQLPKSRTASVGITHRSLSRYSSTTTDGIDVRWDVAPARRNGGRPVTRHLTIMLLPWPLAIHERDFVPVPGSVHRPEREPFGFFTYTPSEPLDLGLVEGLLDAALEEVDGVDVVVMPEGCLDERQVSAMHALLGRRGVGMLVTGVRPDADPGRTPGNVLHTGLNLDGAWWQYRQNKHHRWFLDAGQIEAYNIAGALHPRVRWWEAMDIPERGVHVLELGGATVAAVVCEDLARQDGVAGLLRSIGPTLLVTLLLDGPQLASRWTARYAGVLADDPGCAVLTLTALGMTLRSQPRGMPLSRVVALWKDPVRGAREITLEPGAQGILLTAVLDTSTRYAADGRRPVDDVTDFYVAGVHQLRATSVPPGPDHSGPAVNPQLDATQLSVLAAWGRAVAQGAPVAQARPDAPWRADLGLSPPEGRLAEALEALADVAGGEAGGSPLHDLARTMLQA